ncbi:antitoxin Xre/MbcA/ParS toxin-binding domain-containing protein [Pseudomonas fluorescens]|uniref:antitoxin Xre/MbcA/ParS toxin-binding domain-containing protein n=1 Tax=Pseudomonas fluorescens TaxID=294 RepID=UPI00374A78C3
MSATSWQSHGLRLGLWNPDNLGMPMASSSTQVFQQSTRSLKPTEYLMGSESGELSEVAIALQVSEGFGVSDVQAMISRSALLSSAKLKRRLLGKPARSFERKASGPQLGRLSARKSALVYQYAKILETSISVFGSQQSAEEWLVRPCLRLEGCIPLDLIDNPVGFRLVGDYLERIELGVYQ